MYDRRSSKLRSLSRMRSLRPRRCFNSGESPKSCSITSPNTRGARDFCSYGLGETPITCTDRIIPPTQQNEAGQKNMQSNSVGEHVVVSASVCQCVFPECEQVGWWRAAQLNQAQHARLPTLQSFILLLALGTLALQHSCTLCTCAVIARERTGGTEPTAMLVKHGDVVVQVQRAQKRLTWARTRAFNENSKISSVNIQCVPST